jgi:hypothetical protein
MSEPIVFTATDPLGNAVYMTVKTRDIHISPGHEGEGLTVDDVVYTITDPDKIRKSDQGERWVYDRLMGKIYFDGEKHVRVVTRPVKGSTYTVVSAYPRRNTEAGVDQGVVYYVRS